MFQLVELSTLMTLYLLIVVTCCTLRAHQVSKLSTVFKNKGEGTYSRDLTLHSHLTLSCYICQINYP